MNKLSQDYVWAKNRVTTETDQRQSQDHVTVKANTESKLSQWPRLEQARWWSGHHFLHELFNTWIVFRFRCTSLALHWYRSTRGTINNRCLMIQFTVVWAALGVVTAKQQRPFKRIGPFVTTFSFKSMSLHLRKVQNGDSAPLSALLFFFSNEFFQGETKTRSQHTAMPTSTFSESHLFLCKLFHPDLQPQFNSIPIV